MLDAVALTKCRDHVHFGKWGYTGRDEADRNIDTLVTMCTRTFLLRMRESHAENIKL